MKKTKVPQKNSAVCPLGEAAVKRDYKDSIFRMLFREKVNLLSLYNALNDVSFVFDYELMIYEHQSTINPNMPCGICYTCPEYCRQESETMICMEKRQSEFRHRDL